MDKKGMTVVQLIVVLIIGILVLGFVITFTGRIFPTITEMVGGEIKKIEGQLRSQMTTSGKPVAFDFGDEIDAQLGTSKRIFMGIRNDLVSSEDPSVCYRIGVKCLKAFTPTNFCDPDSDQNNVYVGAYDFEVNDLVESGKNWFPKILPEWDVPNGEMEVEPVVVQVSRVQNDIYLMQLEVYKSEPEPLGCNNPAVTFGDRPWQTVRFRINVGQ